MQTGLKLLYTSSEEKTSFDIYFERMSIKNLFIFSFLNKKLRLKKNN